jgi:hypothetical protein
LFPLDSKQERSRKHEKNLSTSQLAKKKNSWLQGSHEDKGGTGGAQEEKKEGS